MFDATNYNSSCSFSQEIVSYIYGEMTELAKTEFETHVHNCLECAEELASFGVLRSSIQTWKKEEFLPLVQPEIILPFEEKQKTFALVDSSKNTTSWLDSFRNLFRLSPMWMTATASCAVLMICVGLIFVAVSSRQGGSEFAGTNTKTVPTPPVNEGNTKVSPTNSGSENTQKSDQTQPSKPPVELAKKSESGNSVKKTQVAVENNQPTKAKTIPASTSVRSNAPVKKDAKNVPVNKVNNNNLPDLQADDDEDDSLRLTDMFDEIGIK